MWQKLATEARNLVAHAQDMARGSKAPTTTVHYLLSAFVTQCKARQLLNDSGVDECRVLETFRDMPRRDEPTRVLDEVHEQARVLADSSGSDEVDSTVLLASLLRVRRSLASRVLRRAGISLPELRAHVIGQLTFGVDRASSSHVRSAETGLSSRTKPGNRASKRHRIEPMVVGARRSSVAGVDTIPKRATQRQKERSIDLLHPEIGIAKSRSGGVSERSPAPSEPASAVLRPTDSTAEGSSVAPAGEATQAQRSPVAKAPVASSALDRFVLDPAEYPTLCELGRNLTRAGQEGEIEPIIGRELLIDAVIDVLMMRQVNNPCLVGEAGVGKTAIAEGLAVKLAGQKDKYGRLGEAIIVELQVSSLLVGTSYRGAFSERMRKLREEVAKADGRIIIFMDEIHTIMGAGAGDGPLDAANDLKTALSRGKFPLIGATTRVEYRRHIEKDPAMERRFQVVDVPEPDVDEATAILAGVAPTYAQHHGLPYGHEAIRSAVHLAKRFITDRCLPGKAIAVLDCAGAQARRRRKKQVMADDVARAVHVLTQVPMDRLLSDERSRIRNLADDLNKHIIGQKRAMARIARRVQRNYAGFSADRPLASFLFAGSAAVGKTETARVLARALFMVDDALVRFDMSEYSDSHSTSRLIGSPPGYVGHQQPGLLSEAVHKRPYRVLLFDDIDRAAPEVLALVQQVLDSGRITDNQGSVLDMRNCIIVLTTNQGAELLLAGSRPRPIGFGAPSKTVDPTEDVDAALFARVRKRLPDEFWSRIDEAISFYPLDDVSIRAVIRRNVQESSERLYSARLIRVVADDSVIDWLFGIDDLDPSLGVRPLRARVEEKVEAFLSSRVLDGQLQPGSAIRLFVQDNELVLQPLVVDGVDGSQAVTERLEAVSMSEPSTS